MPKTKMEIKFHTKTFEAFSKEKLNAPYEIVAQKERFDKFMSKVKEDKDPVQKIIQTMKRRPQIVFNKDGKAIKKDFLEVNSQLHGKDWLGNDLWIREFIEGIHYEPTFRTTTKLDPETGDRILNKEHNGNTKVYDIELTDKNRKQVIQDIINDANGTFIDVIKFYYEIPNESNAMGFRCGIYTYDQFINSSPDEMIRLARITPSHLSHNNKNKKEYHG